MNSLELETRFHVKQLTADMGATQKLLMLAYIVAVVFIAVMAGLDIWRSESFEAGEYLENLVSAFKFCAVTLAGGGAAVKLGRQIGGKRDEA